MVNRIFLQLLLSIVVTGVLFAAEFSNSDSSLTSNENSTNNLSKNEIIIKSSPEKNNFSPDYAASSTESNDSLMINDTESLPKWYEMITNIPGDWYYFAKQQIQSPNYPAYIVITGLTAGLIATDDATWKHSNKFYTRTQVNRNWSDIFTEIGDGRSQFAFAAGFAAYGFIAGNNRALRTASQIVEAVLASGAVVQLLKHITGRESPIAATSSGGVWRFFPNQIEYHKHVCAYDAFPSGHIATSVAAFTVIAENYPEYKWITPVSCGLTALIGIGMVNKGIHWYSDYPLGIALGYAFGKLIASPGQKLLLQSKADDKVQFSMLPYIDRYSNGIMFRMDF